MDRRLLMAVWALSGLTTVVFAGYWAWRLVGLGATGGPSAPGARAPDGAPAAVGAAVVVVVLAALAVLVLGAVGQLRLGRVRREFPQAAIVSTRVRGGLDAFAERYWADVGRPLLAVSGPLYAAFGTGVLTVLSRSGQEVVSFDTAFARVRLGGTGEGPVAGFAPADASVVVEVSGYPPLVLEFPRAWSLGLLRLGADEVGALVERTRAR